MPAPLLPRQGRIVAKSSLGDAWALQLKYTKGGILSQKQIVQEKARWIKGYSAAFINDQ
jgi:hypothetical protein